MLQRPLSPNSADDGCRSSGSPQSPPRAFSSLEQLFSTSAVLDSNLHASRKDVTANHALFTDPVSVLSNLMDTLREHKIPGPRLLRLKSEFTKTLGYGAQFEVYGLDDSIAAAVKRLAGDGTADSESQLAPVRELTTIAVKQSHAGAFRRRSRTSPGSEEFVFQCESAHREIDALCRKSFQEHPNIVRLLSWGLCLDSLENSDQESPRIPLLVLERAQCNLLQFLTSPSQYCSSFKYNDLKRICLDIGYGLDAIHGQFMAHGDLKPDNILLFKDSGKHGRWRAKLCDFGLSVVETANATSERYRGTPGWCPPEAHDQESVPLSPRDHQRCDVFAYGLVVWSSFVHEGRPPLANYEEQQGQAFELATKQLTKHLSIPKHEHRRIIVTVQGALLSDPKSRRRKPWKILDDQRYSRVGKRIKLLRDLARETFPVRRTLRRPIVQLWRGIASCDWKRIFSCGSTFSPLSREATQQLEYKLERNRVFDTTLGSYRRTLGERSPFDGLNIFGHSPNQSCSRLTEFTKLHDHIIEAIRDGKASLIYALARIRSHIQLCCWMQIRNGRPINMVASLLETKYEFVSLAWMCHGKIGEHEICRESQADKIFHSTYSLPSSFAYQAIRREPLTISEKINIFMLLLEHGGHIESPTNLKGDTVFSRLLSVSNEYKKHGYGDVPIDEICSSFARIARKLCLSPSTRYYMTGALPDMAEADTISFATTALHDSVRAHNYSAVESMVRSGFSVNALDRMGRTALDVAHELRFSSVTKVGRRTKENLYRIIALLEQNCRQTFSGVSSKNMSLPLGWEVYGGPRDDFKIFYDHLSKSVTFIQPKFSLYKDRRLALAGRSFSADNRTYYVDLMRFVSPSTPSDDDELEGLPIYDEEWFRTEPKRSEEGADELANAPETPAKDVASIRARRHKISSKGGSSPSAERLLPGI